MKRTNSFTPGHSDLQLYGFTRLGGIVNFGRRDDKVRLEINLAMAGESRLKLSSKLLGVADVVQHKP